MSLTPRNLTTTTLATACVLLAALGLGTSSASAAITHNYLYQITGFTPGVQTGYRV